MADSGEQNTLPKRTVRGGIMAKWRDNKFEIRIDNVGFRITGKDLLVSVFDPQADDD